MSRSSATCPFNSAHVVHKSRLQHHIIKCMVNYPNHLICPYNALHRLPDELSLTAHMLNCPTKQVLNVLFQDCNPEETSRKCNVAYHIDNVRDFNLAEEDWDQE